MKIGFVNIFSYRPHVEHLFYLASTLEEAGHEVYFLTCDSSVSNCYTKLLKGGAKVSECSKCIVGGVRSFAKKNVSSISKYPLQRNVQTELIEKAIFSSSSTLIRIETNADVELKEFRQTSNALFSSAERVYSSSFQWIKEKGLEGIICFNGRIDLTRAVTTACEQLNVPFVTHERPWLGHGLQLIPNDNCLSLSGLRKIVEDFESLPLTREQALYATNLLRIRFTGDNHLEWRLYNTQAKNTKWPLEATQDKPKILVLPSSRNEFLGHPDWKTEWLDNNHALDDLIDVFDLDKSQIVVRFHPNWSENIGKADGRYPIEKYEGWCKEKGIFYYSATSKANTYDLIKEADLIVVNGGSSAVEAAFCGKQIVCLSPAMYTGAKFVTTFTSRQGMLQADGLPQLVEHEIIISVLRFMYVMARRFPQYVDYVRAILPIKYEYRQGADAERLVKMLKTGILEPDDSSFANDDKEELEVVNQLLTGNLSADDTLFIGADKELVVSRRILFRWIDGARNRFKLGDR